VEGGDRLAEGPRTMRAREMQGTFHGTSPRTTLPRPVDSRQLSTISLLAPVPGRVALSAALANLHTCSSPRPEDKQVLLLRVIEPVEAIRLSSHVARTALSALQPGPGVHGASSHLPSLPATCCREAGAPVTEPDAPSLLQLLSPPPECPPSLRAERSMRASRPATRSAAPARRCACCAWGP
jgi:hypothetical protein